MWDTRDNTGLRPRGKGRKLAWQGALHENTMMLRMRMLPNLLPVATGRPCPRGGLERQPNCLCFLRLEIPPPPTLLKQEGLQLAFLNCNKKGTHTLIPHWPPQATPANTKQHQAKCNTNQTICKQRTANDMPHISLHVGLIYLTLPMQGITAPSCHLAPQNRTAKIRASWLLCFAAGALELWAAYFICMFTVTFDYFSIHIYPFIHPSIRSWPI